MDNSYEIIAGIIDSCENIDELNAFRKKSRAITLRDEFWTQRKIALTTDDLLEKEKALAKADWLQNYFGSSIPISKRINKFSAPYGLFGIFVSNRATVGKNCVIFHHVSIIANTLEDSQDAGFPAIGENVYIGAGARIVGNVTVGDNARIGANSYVTTDVPANSHVIGGEIQIIPRIEQNDNSLLSLEKFAERRYRTVFDYLENSDRDVLRIEKGTEEELDDILQVYRERIAFLRWKGISQWKFYMLNHPREEFIKAIYDGEYYTVKSDDQIVAGFRLSEDSENWMDEFPEAIYLSRVVTKPGFRNIGDYIMKQAKKMAKEAGKSVLRVECVFSNQRLNDIWKDHGFAFIRDEQNQYHYSLLECKL